MDLLDFCYNGSFLNCDDLLYIYFEQAIYFTLQIVYIIVMGYDGVIVLILFQMFSSSVQTFAVNRNLPDCVILITVCTEILKFSQHNHITSLIY